MKDPYETLGLDRSADNAEVKRAFRMLAMRYHPDMSTETGAAQRFEEVRKAADEILNRARRPTVHAAGGAPPDVSSMSWRTERLTRHALSLTPLSLDMVKRISNSALAERNFGSLRHGRHTPDRHPRFAALFSAACLVGGCVIFVGALRVHQGLYTYNRVPGEMEEGREPSEAQMRIRELLMEKRQASLSQRGKDGERQ